MAYFQGLDTPASPCDAGAHSRPAARTRMGRQASGSERVIHVDEQDRELGVVSRADAQSRGLITRCTFIFVFNSRGELCVHQRTPHKRRRLE